MSKAVENIESALATASKKYSDQILIRALVNMVPYIGGYIDLLITNQHENVVKKRIEELINNLKLKVEQLEESQIDKNFLTSDLAHDLFFVSFEKTSRIRDRERIKGIAELLVRTIRNDIKVDISPIDAITILGELSENESFFLAKVYELYTTRTDLLEGSENSLFTEESILQIIPTNLHIEASVNLRRLEGKGLISSLFEYYKLTQYAKTLVQTAKLMYS